MSQREAKEISIGGHKYQVFMLPPKAARHILLEMMKVVGPAIGTMADGAGLQGVLDSEVDLGKAITLALDRLDNETLDRHFSELAKVTHVNGTPLEPVFELHFMGRLGEQFEWYAFAVRSNFSDFFPALGRVFSQFAPALEAAKAKLHPA